MNILIINVCLRPNSVIKMFPVGLGYIATAIKNAGYDFDLLDIDGHRPTKGDIYKFLSRKKYDLICMGCIVTGYPIIKELAELIKELNPNAKIIVGNTVASSIYKILLSKTKIDIAVLGEGDLTIVDLINSFTSGGALEDIPGIAFLKDGVVTLSRPRPVIKDISSLPFIDFSIFDMGIYLENSKEQVSDPLPIPREQVRMLPVNTARGCIAKCTFCHHAFYGQPYRRRSNASILYEIRNLIEKYQINYVGFSDELTFYSKKQTAEFVQDIIDSDLRFYWVGNCRADLFDCDDDLELLEKMKKSGCHGLAYSLESADPQILKAMNKKITVEQFSKQSKLAHQAGLPIWTSLVFGYPQETKETISKTFDVCVANRVYPSSGYLLPQPGSPMYQYALEHGFIADEEEYLLKMGDRQDLKVNMTKIADDEFEKAVLDGARRCNEVLKVGLSEDNLIKTQYYRSSSRK